ncbi:MAG: IspD/TarI family cytidylyltransferase [bacterium]
MYSHPPETELTDVGLVVAAAGAGRRFGTDRNKLLCDLRNRPLFIHCLCTLAPHFVPAHVVLVTPPNEDDAFERALTEANLPAGIRRVPGGSTRTESVIRGLEALPPSVRIAAIQDAARPDTTLAILLECVASSRKNGSGVAAHRVTDTVKIADPDGRVRSTPARSSLWAAETPQVFRMPDILDACRQALRDNAAITDDAQALERLNRPVHLVENTTPNPKITFQHDIPDFGLQETA